MEWTLICWVVALVLFVLDGGLVWYNAAAGWTWGRLASLGLAFLTLGFILQK